MDMFEHYWTILFAISNYSTSLCYSDVVYSEFADPVVAEATLDFINVNKKKLLSSFPTLLPQVWFNIYVALMLSE